MKPPKPGWFGNAAFLRVTYSEGASGRNSWGGGIVPLAGNVCATPSQGVLGQKGMDTGHT